MPGGSDFTVAERYLRTASVRKTPMITTDQISDAHTGCCIGHALECTAPGLPKSTRAACTVALNGFHSATCRSQAVIRTGLTNALDTNVTGKSQIRPPEVAASGVRTDRPISAPIHEKAYPSRSSSANAPSIRGMPLCTRQPTSSPTHARMAMVKLVCTRSASVRPVSTAPRDIGSERNRSTRPFCMSSAMPAPAPAVAKVTVCAKMPAIRNSRYAPASTVPPMFTDPPKT